MSEKILVIDISNPRHEKEIKKIETRREKGTFLNLIVIYRPFYTIDLLSTICVKLFFRHDDIFYLNNC